VRIHFAAEHAPELQLADLGLEAVGFALDVAGGGLVSLALGKLQQGGRITQRVRRAIQLGQLGGEPRAFAPQFLRALGRRPDGRVLELPAYFLEPFLLAVVFKETPSRRRHAPRDLSGCA